MGLLDDLDATCDMDDASREIIKPPMPWPGGKGKATKDILPYLPLGTIYVEPFGGSGAVLFARPKVKLEVYNDRYSGVTDFYKAIQDPLLCEQLVGKLHATIHSREFWHYCQETWDSESTTLDRAFKWYYMWYYSFGGLGRNWGRGTGTTGTLAGRLRGKLPSFPLINERLRNVQIENLDWSHCFKDYDNPDTVFYCDPPYLEVYEGTYKEGGFGKSDHIRLLETAFDAKGFVAISSYDNELYNKYPWDHVHSFDKIVTIQSVNGNSKKNDTDATRSSATEMLYIKEAT